MPEPAPLENDAGLAEAVQDPPAGARLITFADAVPLGALGAILVLIFWRVLFAHELFFYRDVFSYTYPRALFIRATLRSGHLPYWNPYFSFGEPALANPNYLFFYPSTLLVALLPSGLAYSLHYVLSFAWAASGTYFLARRWDQSRLAAFFASATFAFSGPVLSLGNLYNQAAAASCIPWALLATDYAVRSRSRRPWILLGIVFASQFLGAEPLTLYATFSLALAYGLFCTFGRADGGSARSALRVLLGFAATGAIMLALGAIQLLPSLDVLHRARRGASGLPYGEVIYWSLHPLSLLELALPGFFGNALDPSPLWTYVLAGRNQPYYVSIFLGFIPLLAAWLGWREGKARRRTFVGIAALLMLLLACGRYTPVFAEAYLLFPPLALVRFPAKLLVPAVFMLAILAGWGIDAIRHPSGRSLHRGTMISLAALGIMAALVWVISIAVPGWIGRAGSVILQRTNELFAHSPGDQLRPADIQAATAYLRSVVTVQFGGLVAFFFGAVVWLRALAMERSWARRGLPVVVALGVVQMVWANYRDNPTVPSSFYSYRPPVTFQPPDPSGPYRFAFIQRDQSAETTQPLLNFESVPEARTLSPAAQLAFRDRLLLSRGAMSAGVEMAENLDMEGSLPPAYYEFWLHETHGEAGQSQADCMLGRANVKYIVRQVPLESATTREIAPIFNGSPEASAVYEDFCFMPRAYAARNARESKSDIETLTELSDSKFDAHNDVILEVQPAPFSEGDQAIFAGGASRMSQEIGTVRITESLPNLTVVQAQMPEAGYVVLLDRWDPGWQAAVDGHPAELLVANHMFRAVRVSAGVHKISFSYHPRGLALGACISVVSLLLVIAAWYGVGTKRPGQDKDLDHKLE